MQPYIIDILVVVLLLVLNGVLAMTEIAIVSSNRNKLNNMAKTNKGAKCAANLIDKPGEFLSTVQIGITIIGIISGAFSGQKFAEPLGTWLNKFIIFNGYGSFIAFIIIVIILTYTSLVIGELFPKRVGLAQPEKIAANYSRFIQF